MPPKHPQEYVGKKYESPQWDENLYWAEVLEVDGNTMIVHMKSEHDEWKEDWNLGHFEQGLKTGFYREYKTLLGH